VYRFGAGTRPTFCCHSCSCCGKAPKALSFHSDWDEFGTIVLEVSIVGLDFWVDFLLDFIILSHAYANILSSIYGIQRTASCESQL